MENPRRTHLNWNETIAIIWKITKVHLIESDELIRKVMDILIT
jgi:hypothetical protein